MTRESPDQKSAIVENGGWMKCEHRQRSKQHFYSLMSVLWIFPSLGALAMLLMGDLSWRQEPDFSTKLGLVPLDQWLAFATLFIHPWFIVFAIRTKNESPAAEPVFSEPNPDYDRKNLY